MTRPDRQGPFALLVRNFFHGLFESDLIPENVDLRQSLVWMGVLLMWPSSSPGCFVRIALTRGSCNLPGKTARRSSSWLSSNRRVGAWS